MCFEKLTLLNDGEQNMYNNNKIIYFVNIINLFIFVLYFLTPDRVVVVLYFVFRLRNPLTRIKYLANNIICVDQQILSYNNSLMNNPLLPALKTRSMD